MGFITQTYILYNSNRFSICFNEIVGALFGLSNKMMVTVLVKPGSEVWNTYAGEIIIPYIFPSE